MYVRLSYYFSICAKRARMAHILHDISGDIRILKSRYYPNISAAVRRWVLLDDAISEGHISCRFSRRCLSAVAVVCCCLLRLSCDFMDIYSFSMSHKVYYVNYSRFIGGFLGWCRRVRALLPLMDRHEKLYHTTPSFLRGTP